MVHLDVQSLVKRYGSLVAVDGVTLSIHQGEVFGLLGPNGAGKTSTLNIIATLHLPTSGRVCVCGHDVVRAPNAVRRCIGLVPQMLSSDGLLTGYENLMSCALLYHLPRRERRARVESALDQMGLGDVAHELVRGYSGGMIRRLEIAQSLLHQPQVVLLDEPTVGLDPVARRAVWAHIRTLRDTYGATVMLTTHFMEEADTLCDRVAIMHHGRVVVMDTPHALKASLERPDATLDDVFVHYAGDSLAGEGDFRAVSRVRRTARRLG